MTKTLTTPIVVPETIRRKAGLRRGEEVEFRVIGRAITIVPKDLDAVDEYTTAERRAIDRGIAASEKDYKEGRSYGPFATHEEFIASLNRESAKLRGKRKTKRAAK